MYREGSTAEMQIPTEMGGDRHHSHRWWQRGADMTEMVKRAMASMLAGSLRYYADEAQQNGDGATAHDLSVIADHIEDGTATEAEWLEAIEQVDMSDDVVQIAW